MNKSKICYWQAMYLCRTYAHDKGCKQWMMDVRGSKLYVRLGSNTRYTCIGEAPIDMTT